MGRPRTEISEEAVELAASLGAPNTEIADFFGVTEAVIRKRFSEILLKGRAARRMKLREFQWKAAERGNTAMLIWLGKQDLGQTEKIQQELSMVEGATFIDKEDNEL